MFFSKLTFPAFSSKVSSHFFVLLIIMTMLNIAGYKFISLTELSELRVQWLTLCEELGLKGTILLSTEGVNITLAGLPNPIATFKHALQQDARFADITFRESVSLVQPFKQMKIKLRKEIITMRRPEVQPNKTPAPSISPQEFKQWLDENRDITILDTRNDYEVRFGTFRHAKNLYLNDFSEFPEAVENVTREKPVVMFCTGGIRCEKAAIHLLNKGFSEVYQLQGGILNYFSEVGGAHYDGECFVFDQRVAVDECLRATDTLQCTVCAGPVKPTENCLTCMTN